MLAVERSIARGAAASRAPESSESGASLIQACEARGGEAGAARCVGSGIAAGAMLEPFTSQRGRDTCASAGATPTVAPVAAPELWEAEPARARFDGLA